VESLISLLADSNEVVTQQEFNTFLKVSDEEWEIIKPTRLERTMTIVGRISAG